MKYSLLLFLVFTNMLLTQTSDRVTKLTIESKILNESREIYIQTPMNYDPIHKKYQVVYVLDGEWNFDYIASYVDYMNTHASYPELIVTGIRNTNRNRDYLPKRDSYFEDSGKADIFLKFVKDEWIQKIDNTLSTSEKRILVGHSFGGVFTLHTFFQETSSFDAYISLSSSSWVSDEILFDEAKSYFEKKLINKKFLYMAVGEADGGPTRPSTQRLSLLFEKNDQKNLEWYFVVTPKTEHFRNFISGVHDGFMTYFPSFGFDNEIDSIARNDNKEAIKNWFNNKKMLLGDRFHPNWFDLSIVALNLAQEDYQETALELMKHLKDYYPNNGNIANFSATLFEICQQYLNALNEYERAIKIVTEQKLHPNTIHLKPLKDGLKRMKNKIEK